MKSGGYRCLEGTRRSSNHDHDVKRGSKAGETDERVRNRGLDGPHVLAESACKQEKRRLERQRETLDEEHFFSPSHFRWRSPQRSITEPLEFRRHRFSHCFPNIAMNTANSEIRRLAYTGHVMVTISPGGTF